VALDTGNEKPAEKVPDAPDAPAVPAEPKPADKPAAKSEFDKDGRNVFGQTKEEVQALHNDLYRMWNETEPQE
jgi:hypothetical protein